MEARDKRDGAISLGLGSALGLRGNEQKFGLFLPVLEILSFPAQNIKTDQVRYLELRPSW